MTTPHFRAFLDSIDRSTTHADTSTVPHGPHQRPNDYCPREGCLGRDWPNAVDRRQNYGVKLFGRYPFTQPQ
jgi:hypothetical protein